jgi:hypothetical protein
MLLQTPDNLVEYEVVGDDKARNYFMVNARSGEVSLMRSLTLDGQDSYNVSITKLTYKIQCTKLTSVLKILLSLYNHVFTPHVFFLLEFKYLTIIILEFF